MRIGSTLSLVSLVVVAVSTARCSGSGGETPAPIARCEADLTPWTKTGSGAQARLATSADLFSGDAALGRAGDVLLETTHPRHGRDALERAAPSRRAATSSMRTSSARGSSHVTSSVNCRRF